MPRHFDDYAVRGAQAKASAHVDQGLRSYMLGIYNYMTLGVAITGFLAYLVASVPAFFMTVATPPLNWIFMLAPVGFVFFLSARINHLQVTTARALFFTYCALMGISLSFIFAVFSLPSITRVFFITSSMFAGMSLYGYTTRKDLTSWGSFFMMGLIGLLIASIVNIFMKSSALEFVISAVGVLVFTGLTAYDTQNIKYMYHQLPDQQTRAKASVIGALRLYLDFINLFLMMLRFFGDRR